MESIGATWALLPSSLQSVSCLAPHSKPFQTRAFLSLPTRFSNSLSSSRAFYPSSQFLLSSSRAFYPSSQFLLAALVSISTRTSPPPCPCARVPVDAPPYGDRFSSKSPLLDLRRGMSSLKRSAERASTSVAPPDSLLNGRLPVYVGTTLAVTAAILVVAVLTVLVKSGERAGGSVADLVKRGQLRSDRRSDSRPLRYEDPFNNPLVRMGEKNSVVKMHGKMFRLQPVTLTEEKMLTHQNRRVQAYQWKRPTVFLVEGEPIPDGVDPDTVRWIPPNHPFATAKNDIDELAAERNIYQTRGVPSRVRAEHEALRKRMRESAERETNVQLPVMHPGISDEGIKVEKPGSLLSEQPESGLGSRPIKPFDKPDTDITAKLESPVIVHSVTADTGQSFSDGRFVDGKIVG